MGKHTVLLFDSDDCVTTANCSIKTAVDSFTPYPVEHSRCRADKRCDLDVDDFIQVLRHAQPVHPLAHADVKNRSMHPPDELNLMFVLQRCRRGNTVFLAHFCQNDIENSLTQAGQITVIDSLARHAGKSENPDPVASEDDSRVLPVKTVEPILQRATAIGENFFPLRIPAREINLFEYAVDQRLLVRKVAVQQRLRNAYFSCQIACACRKSVRRKIPDGLG